MHFELVLHYGLFRLFIYLDSTDGSDLVFFFLFLQNLFTKWFLINILHKIERANNILKKNCLFKG